MSDVKPEPLHDITIIYTSTIECEPVIENAWLNKEGVLMNLDEEPIRHIDTRQPVYWFTADEPATLKSLFDLHFALQQQPDKDDDHDTAAYSPSEDITTPPTIPQTENC